MKKSRRTHASIAVSGALAALLGACSNPAAGPDGGVGDGAQSDGERAPDLAGGGDASAALLACEADLVAAWTAHPPTTGIGPAGAAPSYEKVIGKLMSDFGVPGGAVAVARDGRLVFAEGFGFADDLLPAHPDDLFRVASLSKQITAAAILKLVEAGKLSLDEKALPIVADLKPLPGRMQNPPLGNITVRNLLNHTGGWNRDSEAVGDPMFDSRRIASALGAPGPASCEDTIRFMLDKPLTYAPGSTMCYSNFGYCILGRIIERRSAMTYSDYVNAAVLAPVGATHMRLGRTLPDGRADNEVHYFDFPGASLADSVFPSVPGKVPWPYGGWNLEAMDSHGAWIASPVEMLRYQLGVDGRAPDIVSPQSLAAMLANPGVPSCTQSGGTQPADPAYWYGFGWAVNKYGNHWHTGSLDGTATEDVTASNGFSWAAFFNTRPRDANGFASRLDQDLWTAFSGTTAWSGEDYFDQFGSFSDWIDEIDYAAELDHQMSMGRYPLRIEGRVDKSGKAQYRAEWAPLHASTKYESTVGMGCLDYRSTDEAMRKKGYRPASIQWFERASGVRSFQAVWGEFL